MTSFLLLPHKFFKGTHRNPKAVLAKSRSVVICLCFRILFGRSFRNQIDSLGKQTLQTLSLPEWMMEFVRWFLLLHLWTKSCGATIQMKSLWKYFHVVLFVLKNLQNEIWDFCRIYLRSYLAVKGLRHQSVITAILILKSYLL